MGVVILEVTKERQGNGAWGRWSGMERGDGRSGSGLRLSEVNVGDVHVRYEGSNIVPNNPSKVGITRIHFNCLIQVCQDMEFLNLFDQFDTPSLLYLPFRFIDVSLTTFMTS